MCSSDLAYVASASAGDRFEDELRTFLRNRLPEHTIPSAFLRLESLPLTSSGKIDRRALAGLPVEITAGLRDFLPPRSQLERKIAAIWQDVLGVQGIGINDNFFDLGGHSLLLAKLHKLLMEQVDETLGIIDLFQYPTVGSLALHIQRKQSVNHQDQVETREAELRAGKNRLRRQLSKARRSA